MKKIVTVVLSLFLVLVLVPRVTIGLDNPSYDLRFPYSIESGDVDGDGNIDFDDLYQLSICYGTEVGDPTYDPNADLDNDNDTDIHDLYEMSILYGTFEVTVHVQDEFGQPIYEAYVVIRKGDYTFIEHGLTDIYGNYETETGLEAGPYMYEVTTPIGCFKDGPFDLPGDTYVLVEPPWNHCAS